MKKFKMLKMWHFITVVRVRRVQCASLGTSLFVCTDKLNHTKSFEKVWSQFGTHNKSLWIIY